MRLLSTAPFLPFASLNLPFQLNFNYVLSYVAGAACSPSTSSIPSSLPSRSLRSLCLPYTYSHSCSCVHSTRSATLRSLHGVSFASLGWQIRQPTQAPRFARLIFPRAHSVRLKPIYHSYIPFKRFYKASGASCPPKPAKPDLIPRFNRSLRSLCNFPRGLPPHYHHRSLSFALQLSYNLPTLLFLFKVFSIKRAKRAVFNHTPITRFARSTTIL
nr:MAG TPA: hypothetical protein [Caudoviricetes sp.]